MSRPPRSWPVERQVHSQSSAKLRKRCASHLGGTRSAVFAPSDTIRLDLPSETRGTATLFNHLILRIERDAIQSFDFAGDVVDLGCGRAGYRDVILRAGARYVGVDWADSPHDTSNADIIADLTADFPLESECADIVTAFQVLEHIPNTAHFLSECARLLRPGGRLYLTTPFMWRIHEAPHDYYRFTRYGLAYAVTQAGLAVESIAETTGFWQTRVLSFNYHAMRSTRGPLRRLLAPLLLPGQALAPLLDRVDSDCTESASYRLCARKPTKRLASAAIGDDAGGAVAPA